MISEYIADVELGGENPSNTQSIYQFDEDHSAPSEPANDESDDATDEQVAEPYQLGLFMNAEVMTAAMGHMDPARE